MVRSVAGKKHLRNVESGCAYNSIKQCLGQTCWWRVTVQHCLLRTAVTILVFHWPWSGFGIFVFSLGKRDGICNMGSGYTSQVSSTSSELNIGGVWIADYSVAEVWVHACRRATVTWNAGQSRIQSLFLQHSLLVFLLCVWSPLHGVERIHICTTIWQRTCGTHLPYNCHLPSLEWVRLRHTKVSCLSHFMDRCHTCVGTNLETRRRNTSSLLYSKSCEIEGLEKFCMKNYTYLLDPPPKISLRHDHDWTRGNDELGSTVEQQPVGKLVSTVLWISSTCNVLQTNPTKNPKPICDRSEKPENTEDMFVVKGETSRSHEIDEKGLHEELGSSG